MKGVRSVYRLTFLHVDMCLVVLAPVVEKRIFVLFHGRNQLTTVIWVYFWSLNSVTMIDVSVFWPIPCCLDHHSFIRFNG